MSVVKDLVRLKELPAILWCALVFPLYMAGTFAYFGLWLLARRVRWGVDSQPRRTGEGHGGDGDARGE